MQNIFQIYAQLGTLPFAASRQNWDDSFFIVVTHIRPKGDYGKAYGFTVDGSTPNDHLAYTNWRKNMELPNVGSYQWRPILKEEKLLNSLVEDFYNGIGLEYGFEESDLDEIFDD